MVSAFVIMFREMLEMSMVLGMLFVVTRPVPSARRWIYIGALIGLGGASFVAAFMHEMENSLQGAGEMVFNAVVLAVASVMIGWTVVWMSRHGRELSQRMQKVGQAVSVGELPQTALLMVSLAAVLREGSEAVFFMWGAAMAVPHDGLNMTIGGALGGFTAVALGYGMYKGLLRVPVNHILRVAGWLLILLAAGMAGKAAGLFVDIGWLPGFIFPLWNTSHILPADGNIGQFLNVMIGYNDAPSTTQVGVFATSLITMIWLYLHYAKPVRASNRQDEAQAQQTHGQEGGEQPQSS
jgi:high-affinity iron transporter